MTAQAAASVLRSRAGVRLAIVQAAIVVMAFLFAGYMAQISLNRIGEATVRAHVVGEAASLDEEFAQKGASHLSFTVAKRSRLWRGFDYRLVSSSGAVLAGRLQKPEVVGWSRLDTGPAGATARHYLTLTKRMPDGSVLTVGQDMAFESGEMDAIRRALLACGLLGVVFCIGASCLFARQTWRRIDALAATAHAVSTGRLDVRAPAPNGRPSDDIDGLALAFNAMLDRIAVLMGQVRQVSTDIAHDLRTPLTRFAHKLERLRAKVGADPDLLSAVTALESDVGEILRTFDALLQLSDLEAHPDARSVKAADLGELAVRVAEAYRPDIEETGRILTVHASSAMIAGDGDLIAQALANLLENALRHTPAEAHIAVIARAVGDDAELIVEDNGPGIAREHRQRAIQPFVRLEPSRQTPGSGLGLAIVAAVAARHGATLNLEDANPGLRIRLTMARLATNGPSKVNMLPAVPAILNDEQH